MKKLSTLNRVEESDSEGDCEIKEDEFGKGKDELIKF